ncbi:hypothetical protein [Leptolyngbya sp. NIES-2104]|nr:hypothetical protein [Leptolyngbya sp. NIES-2104]GAP98382.1 hypothetical protein NIES2104_49370 [Leptolyngbya sp. NIES-2104]
MKLLNRQKLEKNRALVDPEAMHKEPEGHVHPNYRHWVYLRRSSDR